MGPAIAYVSNASGWVLFNLLSHTVSRAIAYPPAVRAVTVVPGGTTAYGIGQSGIVAIDLRTGSMGAPFSRVSNCQSISTGGNGRTLNVAR
jgi:hypothetical protein